jgi:microcystin-dependent protein
MADYSLNVGNLPQGFCPTTYQAMVNGIGQALSVSIPSASGITISAAKPSDSSNVWYQIDSLGRFLRMYLFGQGSWLSAHPLASGLTMWWFNALPNFATFDGGDGNAIGPASGAMWQQAKDGNGVLIEAAFPVTAGALPSATVLSIGDSGGEELHTLTLAELPTHYHFLANTDSTGAGGVPSNNLTNTAFPFVCWQNLLNYTYNLTGTTTVPSLGESSSVGNGNPNNNMPPYVVGYLLQRTTRQFYSVI